MRKYVLATFLLNSFFSFLWAQEKDFQVWNSFEAEYKASKTFSFVLEEEIRWNRNSSRFSQHYSDLSMAGKISKTIKATIHYRFTEKRNNNDFYSFRHRLMADLSARKKAGLFIFSYRLRLQSQWKDMNTSENGNIPDWFLRQKAEIKFSPKGKINPFAFFEHRILFSNGTTLEPDEDYLMGRVAGGFSYEIFKRLSFDVYFLHQWENERIQIREYNLCTGISISL